jgi:hypothetical protein
LWIHAVWVYVPTGACLGMTDAMSVDAMQSARSAHVAFEHAWSILRQSAVRKSFKKKINNKY